MAIIVSCSKCNSHRVGHVEHAFVSLLAASWERNTDTDEVEPDAFTGDAIVDWDSTDSVDVPYQCVDCGHEMTAEDLVVTEHDAPPVIHEPTLATLRDAAASVIENWEHGDLAEAVRQLDFTLNGPEAA